MQNMKHFKLAGKLYVGVIALACMVTACNGQPKDKETEVVLETTHGEIRLRLYDDTPLHRDNFIQNVREGKYDGVTWHRIIRNFMIQTGEQPVELDANGDTIEPDLSELVPAEFVYPKYFHRRGVVGAARMGDEDNPERRSDLTQFYIVTGRTFTDDGLRELAAARTQRAVDQLYKQKAEAKTEELEALRKARDHQGVSNLLEKLLDEAKDEIAKKPAFEYPEAHRRYYRNPGGAPWLDGEYTIFGEVVEGMKTVLAIEKVKTGAEDRPLVDVRILKAYVVE